MTAVDKQHFLNAMWEMWFFTLIFLSFLDLMIRLPLAASGPSCRKQCTAFLLKVGVGTNFQKVRFLCMQAAHKSQSV